MAMTATNPLARLPLAASGTRRRARIVAEVYFKNALGQYRRPMPRGPCEISTSGMRGQVSLYIRNDDGIEFSYDLGRACFQRFWKSGAVKFDGALPAEFDWLRRTVGGKSKAPRSSVPRSSVPKSRAPQGRALLSRGAPRPAHFAPLVSVPMKAPAGK